jgi:hypothetical protein
MKITGGTVRAKCYALFSDAVEVGLRRGWIEAYKHSDAPTDEDVWDHQQQEVMAEICERFTFDDD